jgi:hypothetical protein
MDVLAAQFVREFTKLGLTRSVGGVLALALSRELTPVVTAIIIAGRVGSAFAAELGTMQVGLYWSAGMHLPPDKSVIVAGLCPVSLGCRFQSRWTRCGCCQLTLLTTW